jgi:hypothetical protein
MRVARGNSTALPALQSHSGATRATEEATMHGIIYLVGLIVVIMAILSFFGLR